VVSPLTSLIAQEFLTTRIDQVYTLVFAFNPATFTDSTTLSASAVPVLFNNARTALVSHSLHSVLPPC
jgi:hypothetical protein